MTHCIFNYAKINLLSAISKNKGLQIVKMQLN